MGSIIGAVISSLLSLVAGLLLINGAIDIHGFGWFLAITNGISLALMLLCAVYLAKENL